MGANVSTNVQNLNNSLVASLKSDCSPTAAVTQEIRDVRVILSGNAKCDTLQVKNKAVASSKCNIDAAVETLVDGAMKLTNKQKAGLGINYSSTRQNFRQDIENRLQASCGSAASIKQSIRDMDFELRDNAQCELLSFLNDADANASCVINLVNKATSKLLAEAETEQVGYDPLEFLKSWGFVIIIAIVGVLVLAFLLLRGGGGGGRYDPRYDPRYYRQ